MRQPSEARVELREREDIVRSVGQRYDAANRAKEIAEFEKNSGAQ
jgi:hypothetical protein